MVRHIYKLCCSPNSQGIEEEVNKILSENEGAKFTFFAPVCGSYFNRRLETDCPKCGSEVIEVAGTYLCSSCKEQLDEDIVRRLAKTKFSQAGTLFLQSLIIENAEPLSAGR